MLECTIKNLHVMGKSDLIDKWVPQNTGNVGLGTCTCVYVLKKTTGLDATGNEADASGGVDQGDVLNTKKKKKWKNEVDHVLKTLDHDTRRNLKFLLLLCWG
ncbi:MAG: hypothetical protein GY820_15690 [Gammaproteobacteria bacterium]|nr:hypothetical protein [Gammaproteobacteria bacterium]